MKKFQKTALIEVVGTTNDGDYLVQNEDNDTDRNSKRITCLKVTLYGIAEEL
ncbi:hypothetical protein [Solibacillus sp. R5-41]|uniref:hypothetical protein n=1 Tax=Solibacillus sp. R5-41 TaxID=2048654 RepID=UPI0012FD84BE|nr:hypothetical protein [Solibacillus sp. R5-41]